jgi:hypothetical protein
VNAVRTRCELGAYGYQVERLSDWAGLLRDNPATENCGDYANQKRITAVPRIPGRGARRWWLRQCPRGTH